MVAGDIVNTASRLQSVAPPGTVLVGESTYRAASEAIAFEPAGRAVLKGKDAPVPAFRAIRVVAERGGRGRGEARGAVRRPRQRAQPAQGPLPRHRRERRTRLVSIVGAAARQDPARLGVLEVPRRPRRDGPAGTPGRSPAYGEGITFWALGEMVRSAPAWPRPTTSRRPGRRSRRPSSDGCPTSTSALDRGRAPRPAGRRQATQMAPTSCSRRGGRSSSGSPPRAPSRSSSRTCIGPIPARSTSSTNSSSGAAASRSSSSPSPDRSCSSIDRTGVRAGATSWRSASSLCRSPPSASCSPSSFRVSPMRRSERSPNAPTASRSTRSRRSGCWSPRAAWRRPTAATSRRAT